MGSKTLIFFVKIKYFMADVQWVQRTETKWCP